MCDYSLEMYASRPAREGERYVTTRFPSGSVGLAAPGDCTTAVCVQYDTHLRLENISGDLQTRLGIKAGGKRLSSRALNMALIATAYVSRTARKSRCSFSAPASARR